MAIKISNTDVINNSRKGIFASMNPGSSTTNPSSPSTGDIYYNSSAQEIRVYNGSAWIAQN